MAQWAWKLVVTELGTQDGALEAVVSADNWLSALRAGRKELGEDGGVPQGASCVMSSTGDVTILDAARRRRYVLVKAVPAVPAETVSKPSSVHGPEGVHGADGADGELDEPFASESSPAVSAESAATSPEVAKSDDETTDDEKSGPRAKTDASAVPATSGATSAAPASAGRASAPAGDASSSSARVVAAAEGAAGGVAAARAVGAAESATAEQAGARAVAPAQSASIGQAETRAVAPTESAGAAVAQTAAPAAIAAAPAHTRAVAPAETASAPVEPSNAPARANATVGAAPPSQAATSAASTPTTPSAQGNAAEHAVPDAASAQRHLPRAKQTLAYSASRAQALKREFETSRALAGLPTSNAPPPASAPAADAGKSLPRPSLHAVPPEQRGQGLGSSIPPAPKLPDDLRIRASEPARSRRGMPLPPRFEGLVPLSSRDIDPTPQSPLTYRERSFLVPRSIDRTRLESLLHTQFEIVRKELANRPRGQLVHLAAFDHSFEDRPQRPPIATLEWRDWRGTPVFNAVAEADVEAAVVVPASEARAPESEWPAPARPSVPAAAPAARAGAWPPVAANTQAERARPSSSPALAAAPFDASQGAVAAGSAFGPALADAKNARPSSSPPAAPASWPVPPQTPLEPARVLPQGWPAASDNFPHATAVLSAPDPFAPAVTRTPSERPPSDPFAPAVARGERPASDPFAPAVARGERPASDPFAPAVRVPSERPAAAPAVQAPVEPSTAEAFPPAVRTSAEPARPSAPDAFTPAPAPVRPVADPFAPIAAARPSVPGPFAPPPTQAASAIASSFPPAGAQASDSFGAIERREPTGENDSRLATAFEAMSDLYFLPTPVAGLEFTIQLVNRLVPSSAVTGCLYDINMDVFRFVVLTGPGAVERRAEAVSSSAGLFGAAKRDPGDSLVVKDVISDARYDAKADGRQGLEVKTLAYFPLRFSGQLLGMMQLINRENDRGFSSSDVAVMTYITGQLAEFLATRRSLMG